jgi:hypothetical protein
LAFFFLVLAALCPALSADPVPIKGKSGPIIVFDIQSVTATGFVGIRKDNGQTLTVPWARVDLDWLKANQPDTYKSYTDALAAQPAAPSITPIDIAAQLVHAWKMTKADFQGRSSGDSTVGKHTRAYRLALRNPSVPSNRGGGNNNGGNGGGRNGGNNGTPPPVPPPSELKDTNFSVIISISGTGADARTAYMNFVANDKLRGAMTDDMDSAVIALQPLHSGATFAQAELLINAAQDFQNAMKDIAESPDVVRRDSLTAIHDALATWARAAATAPKNASDDSSADSAQ